MTGRIRSLSSIAGELHTLIYLDEGWNRRRLRGLKNSPFTIYKSLKNGKNILVQGFYTKIQLRDYVGHDEFSVRHVEVFQIDWADWVSVTS